MSHDIPKPFLVARDAEGHFRLTVRDVRYNSQGYPIITSTLQSELFVTAAAAKNHAREHFNAQAGQYATK
ncbi:MAG: hypothetical protein ABL914_11170 [Novosphingobium sp.]|uniref:hypothetical protein n=1 Tax=Novosphingobium sp. TaxID=1874826 RepID=UPI0032BAA653